MQAFDTRLVLAPPAWPVVLTAAAVAILACDLAATIHRLARGRLTAAGWVLLGAWIPAIAVLALLAIFFSPAGAIIAIAASATAWAVRSYGRTTSPLSRRWKIFLLAMRISALLLAALWVLRPTLESRSYKDIRATLLVGIDTSRSMSNLDMTAELKPAAADEEDQAISRLRAAAAALREHHDELRQLAERCDVRVFRFAAAAEPDWPLPADADDWDDFLSAADKPATALGDSTSEAVNRYFRAGKEVAAVLLISDGTNNTSLRCTVEQLIERMNDRGVRLFGLGLGRSPADPPGPVRVLTVARIDAADRVEAFNTLPISATIEMLGLADKGAARQVQIKCYFGDELIKTETIAVAAGRQTHRFSHEHVPIGTGTQRLRIVASCVGAPPRSLRGAGEADKLVHVTDRGLRVIYIEGKFRYEAKYIPRALAGVRGLTLQRHVLIEPLAAGEAPKLGEKLEDWLKWHAIIIGDVAPSHFTEGQLKIFRELVGDYGKGFCMIGGRNSFERGAWAVTPVAGMMPIDLGLSTGEINQDIQVTPTADGRRSELMRIGAKGQDVSAAWEKLDKLPGASRLAGVKQGAEVLADAGPAAGNSPLIVAQQYGKGRTLAIAFDTTWRWVLSPKDTAEMQRRFWRQVALYLAAPKGSAWIETDRTRYDLRELVGNNEPVIVSAGLEDSSGTPVVSPRPHVELIAPDGTARNIPLAVDPESRKFIARISPAQLAPTAERPYVLKLKATVDGKELSAQHSFEVTYRDLDSRDVEAHLETLRALAGRTRGSFRRASEFEALIRQLYLDTTPTKKLVTERRDLTASLRWPAIVLIILLLCAEWAIRKRRGLV